MGALKKHMSIRLHVAGIVPLLYPQAHNIMHASLMNHEILLFSKVHQNQFLVVIYSYRVFIVVSCLQSFWGATLVSQPSCNMFEGHEFKSVKHAT